MRREEDPFKIRCEGDISTGFPSGHHATWRREIRSCFYNAAAVRRREKGIELTVSFRITLRRGFVLITKLTVLMNFFTFFKYLGLHFRDHYAV